ncbi:MAG: hypothetical protein K0R05_3286 [Anaerocolumna sp.]|jgi:hypothetical protein|nr:hypothetical protein [Anaerocolumna sp.]
MGDINENNINRLVGDNVSGKEEELKKRLEKIKELEQEVLQKEKVLKDKEKSKKQILLRLSPSLWNELATWAEDDYRSINGQIEYLLAECVRKRKG